MDLLGPFGESGVENKLNGGNHYNPVRSAMTESQ
jgi:hypothetical protein